MQTPRLAVLAVLSVIPLLAACSQSENEIAKGPFPSTTAATSTSATGSGSTSGTGSVPPSDSASAVLSSAAVLKIAESDAKLVLGYDYRTLDSHYKTVEKRMTKTFAAQFATAVDKVTALIKSSHGVVTVTSVSGTVRSFTADVSIDVITLTEHIQSTTQKQTKTASLVVTETHQTNGEWLLSAFSAATTT